MSEQRPTSQLPPERGDRQGLELPTLPGERVVLRAWRPEDRAHLDFDEPTRMCVGPSLPATDPDGFATWLARQRTALTERTALAWCIADPSTDQPWGWIALVEMNENYQYGSAEVAYWVLEGARGQGALSEALRLVRAFAFADEELQLHRLFAITDHRNVASQAVLRKAGFVWCGTERRAMVYTPGGPQYDVVRFELLAPSEWGAAQGPHRHVPNLTDGVIRLRPWRHADAERVRQACTDAESRRWLPLPDPYALADAEAYISLCQQMPTERALPWCVADAETDECLGSVDVRLDPRADAVVSGEVGYWTHPEGRGRGVMTAALRLVQQFCFTPKDQGGGGLERLSLLAADPNAASRRVATKAGFQEVGRDRAVVRLRDGQVVDHVRYDLLAREAQV